MGKRLLVGVMASLATGMVACLVPSFEGMSGAENDTPDAWSGPDGNPAPTNDAGTGDSWTEPVPGGDASPEAAATVSKRFSCGSSGTRCAFGPERCCGIFASTEPVCRTPTNVSDCEGTLPCGDAADCGAGSVCCYDPNAGTGGCQTSCSGPQKMTICDPQKPTCPGSAKCNGRFWGLPYCI